MIGDIQVRVIRHEDQRYATCGDWLIRDGKLDVMVSDTGNWRSNVLVAIHGLVEAFLCESGGVSGEAVEAFDMSFAGCGEPGKDPAAPYRHEHCVAEIVERIVAEECGMEWREHDETVDALFKKGAA